MGTGYDGEFLIAVEAFGIISQVVDHQKCRYDDRVGSVIIHSALMCRHLLTVPDDIGMAKPGDSGHSHSVVAYPEVCREGFFDKDSEVEFR